MKTYQPEAIRNVGLFGHQGTGKTSLAEALVFLSGATTRVGRVEDGNTVCDFEPEEIKKGLSVSLALAPVEWHGHKINLIDVPGYADFIGEAQAALRVVDLAIFVLSAVEGVQVQHQIVWSMAAKLNVPRLVFINKLDRERASFSRTLAELSEKLGSGFAPVDLPIGEEHGFVGVVDVLSRTAYRYDGSGKGIETELSGPLAEEAERLHTQIEESVAESDDALLERYLDGGEISMEEVAHGLAKGLLAGSVTPVLVGSATKLIGIDRLADSIVEEGPSPLARGGAEGHKPGTQQTLQRAPSVDAPTSAFVFKTVSDPYVGRISLFRVFSGRLRPDSTFYNATQGTDERIGHIFGLLGKTQVPLTEVVAGDIAAVAKLAHTHSGDRRGAPGGDPGAAPPQVRRGRGRDPVADPLPGDGPRQGPCHGPPRQADRWARPVRHRPRRRRTLGAGGRVRVRRQDRGRGRAEPVHPVGPERRREAAR
jgi:elongation factor G